jgi:hypothetical protein
MPAIVCVPWCEDGDAPNRGGDDALDDSVHMTADEAVRLATALLKAAEDARTGC